MLPAQPGMLPVHTIPHAKCLDFLQHNTIHCAHALSWHCFCTFVSISEFCTVYSIQQFQDCVFLFLNLSNAPKVGGWAAAPSSSSASLTPPNTAAGTAFCCSCTSSPLPPKLGSSSSSRALLSAFLHLCFLVHFVQFHFLWICCHSSRLGFCSCLSVV